MTPDSLLSRELTLRTVAQFAPLSDVQPCIESYCEEADLHLLKAANDTATRDEIARHAFEVLEWAQQMVSTRRAEFLKDMKELEHSDKYLHVGFPPAAYLRVDL